ncbi:hypothetical protein C446_08139 [Halobiforma nitratireducens JCM 10879]|uniref:Uncharacterized protein n=1 Tax=Halobiforma nitratireducens JCM 10879 TaxID=1227454 RepID=M0M387_9EURY|nr:hypothetical protein C446_08139 [Halobiforma nitratireducens JCM 10879]
MTGEFETDRPTAHYLTTTAKWDERSGSRVLLRDGDVCRVENDCYCRTTAYTDRTRDASPSATGVETRSGVY